MIKTTQELETLVGDAKQLQNPRYMSIQFCILTSRDDKKTVLLHVVATDLRFNHCMQGEYGARRFGPGQWLRVLPEDIHWTI